MGDEVKKVTLIETDSPFAHELVEQQTHRIKCPLCVGGYALVKVEKTRGGAEFDINEPRKCLRCGKYFRLKAVLQIIGVPIT